MVKGLEVLLSARCAGELLVDGVGYFALFAEDADIALDEQG